MGCRIPPISMVHTVLVDGVLMVLVLITVLGGSVDLDPVFIIGDPPHKNDVDSG